MVGNIKERKKERALSKYKKRKPLERNTQKIVKKKIELKNK